MRSKLREKLGDEVLKSVKWFEDLELQDILSDLPKEAFGRNRLRQKASPPPLKLGARPVTKEHPPPSKGQVMKKPAAKEPSVATEAQA